LGTTRWTQGRIAEACELLDGAVAAGAAVPAPAVSMGLDLEVILLPHPFSVYVHVLAGDRSGAEAESAFEAMADAAPDRYAVEIVEMVASAGAVATGDAAWAERAARRGIASDPEATFSFWGRGLRGYLAAALIQQGRVEEGLEQIGPAIDRVVAGGSRSGLALFLATRTAGLASAGRVEDAAASAADARRELDTYREMWAEPLVIEAEALVAHARGDDPAVVADLLRRAVAVATGQGALGVARRVGSTAERLGADVATI
jgi:hypothetical protein